MSGEKDANNYDPLLSTLEKLQHHSLDSSVVTEGHYDASFETEDYPNDTSFDAAHVNGLSYKDGYDGGGGYNDEPSSRQFSEAVFSGVTSAALQPLAFTSTADYTMAGDARQGAMPRPAGMDASRARESVRLRHVTREQPQEVDDGDVQTRLKKTLYAQNAWATRMRVLRRLGAGGGIRHANAGRARI